MSNLRVSLFGLGLMGSGMARQLLKSGFHLTVFNRNPGKAAALAADGAWIGGTPREAAAGADVLISMLADDAASQNVWLGDHGALAGAPRGSVLIESSTVSVAWVNELAAAASKKECDLLDAPVTGSKSHAASGELSFLVGGSAEVLERARPVLEALSKSIVHLGPSGSGALLKLVNNFLCGVQAASLAEALALIEQSGLDCTKALEVITNGAPGSPLLKTLAGRMTAKDYTPNFLLHLMVKDLDYALGEGRKLSLDLATAASALEVFRRAVAAGNGDEDLSAVVEQFRKK